MVGDTFCPSGTLNPTELYSPYQFYSCNLKNGSVESCVGTFVENVSQETSCYGKMRCASGCSSFYIGNKLVYAAHCSSDENNILRQLITGIPVSLQNFGGLLHDCISSTKKQCFVICATGRSPLQQMMNCMTGTSFLKVPYSNTAGWISIMLTESSSLIGLDMNQKTN